MHTKERVQRVMGFVWRQKRAAIALLLVGPLVTGAGCAGAARNGRTGSG